jgi:ferredoxin
MRVQVDREKCIGNGMCAALAPKYFDIDNEGNLIILSEALDRGDEADVESAIVSCPVGAIRILEN